MLCRRSSDGTDCIPIRFQHVQGEEIDVRISQTFDEGGVPVDWAEPRNHEYRMMTFGACDRRREMPPSAMLRPFIFDEFADKLVAGR
jgi:hypothetical protein